MLNVDKMNDNDNINRQKNIVHVATLHWHG